MYLLHPTFIRLPLALTYFRILPSLFPSLEILEQGIDQHGNQISIFTCNGLTCRFSLTVVWFIWLPCLILACKVWKERFDPMVVRSSKWIEEFVVGKEQANGHAAVDETPFWLSEKLSWGKKRLLGASSAA